MKSSIIADDGLKTGSLAKSAVLAAGVLMALLGSAAVQAKCYNIDLKTGAIPPAPIPYTSFEVLPEDFNFDGYYEVVLKVTVASPANAGLPRKVIFKVTYDDDPFQMTVNVGDSATNDGGGGDGGSQSNDAELTIGGIEGGDDDYFDDLQVFGQDGTFEARGTQLIDTVTNVVRDTETIQITVGPKTALSYSNSKYPISGTLKSVWLYALQGEADSEGPVNYDIYAAFNRVIAGNYRWGTGASKVSICL